MGDSKFKFGDIAPIIGPAIGMATNALGIGEGRQDRRQIKQQKELTKIQEEANRRQAEYSQQLAMKMWDETNYGAQTKHMKNAGLNVGLMYGGSGGGGATTGNATAGSVGGGSASDSASATNAATAQTGMGLQMASQIALMKAQKENIEADTENKKAGAENTTTDTEGKKVDLTVKKTTLDSQIEKIQAEAQKAISEADIEVKNNIIKEETYRDEIKGIKAKAAGEIIENYLKETKTNLTKQQIWEIKEKIAQGWENIKFQGTDKVLGKYIEQLVDEVKSATKAPNQDKR